jgi:hypothetical protein
LGQCKAYDNSEEASLDAFLRNEGMTALNEEKRNALIECIFADHPANYGGVIEIN